MLVVLSTVLGILCVLESRGYNLLQSNIRCICFHSDAIERVHKRLTDDGFVADTCIVDINRSCFQ